jgi:hypothetical protein
MSLIQCHMLGDETDVIFNPCSGQMNQNFKVSTYKKEKKRIEKHMLLVPLLLKATTQKKINKRKLYSSQLQYISSLSGYSIPNVKTDDRGSPNAYQ